MAPKQAEGVAKGTISAFLGNLKAAKKNVDENPDTASAVNKRKAEALLYYESLPRFDKEKTELVQKWATDKALQWWETHSRRKVSVNTTATERLKGYATKVCWACFCSERYLSCVVCVSVSFRFDVNPDQYEIADATKIPLCDPNNPGKDHPLLASLLKSLKSDMDWDLSNDYEKSMFNNKVVRYHFDKNQGLDKIQTQDRDEQEQLQQGEVKMSQQQVQALAGGVEIKIENPEYQALGFDVGVVNASEKRITEELTTFRKYKAMLESVGKAEATAKALELTSGIQALTDLQERTLKCGAEYSRMPRDKPTVEKKHAEVRDMIEEISNYLDASKKRRLKTKSYLDSLE
jgi:hypothetical protein